MQWFLAIVSIVLIDVYWRATRGRHRARGAETGQKQRMWGILIGSGMAVLLRVGLTLSRPIAGHHYIKLIGGLLICGLR